MARKPSLQFATTSEQNSHENLRRVAGSERLPLPNARVIGPADPEQPSLAESLTYKAQGFSVIGMTNMPEAKLAREAEICYASVAMVTDFDCWHPDHDAVTVQDII